MHKKENKSIERLESNNNSSLIARAVKQLKKNYILYLFILPTLTWYILFCYFPMGGVYIAFTRYKGIGSIFDAKFVGLKWFRDFFDSVYSDTTIRNTLRISLYSLATFPLPIFMALLINEIRHEKFKKYAQTVMYAPHFVSLVVMVSIITLLMDSKGMVNTTIKNFGGETIDFIGSSKVFPHLFVWSGVWQSLGWDCIIYIAALAGVDPGLHEAAKVDGCSRFKRILHINLPSIAPTIVITLIMRVGKLMTVSTEKTLLLRNTLNMATSETIGTFVYNRGLIAGDFGYAAAVGLFLNIINLILLLIVNQVSKRVSETSLF